MAVWHTLALGHAGADRGVAADGDHPPAVLQVRDGRLDRKEHAAHVHGERQVEVGDRDGVDDAEAQHARVDDHDIDRAVPSDRLGDRGADGVGATLSTRSAIA